jgi:hypothetical protein
MADPKGLTELPETEYIEIYNASDSVISLHNWHFVYDGKETALPDTILPVDGYAVLYRSGRDIAVEHTGIALPVSNFPANLANAGKTIGLRNSHGIEIDTVTYAASKAARSWERNMDNEWYVSTDLKGGTPGAVNSEKETVAENPEDCSNPGDVIINEIMADPKGLTELPETEYVEIYNASDSVISLHNWHFVYDGKETALPDTTLPVNSYAVLYRSGRDITVEHTGIALPVSNFPANLANTGKTIGLRNSHNIDIDTVTYAASKAARSWERSTDNEWYVSTDLKGGTPGAINSSQNGKPENPEDTASSSLFIVYENELVFNEILPEPFVGGSEYIELYNLSERILSLQTLAVALSKADGTLSARYPLTSIIDSIYPDQYIVLTDNRNGVLDFYDTPASAKVYELKLPALNNTGATLVLFRTNDEYVVDRLAYTSKWHHTAIKNRKGVALERIHPHIETQSAANWTSANAMAGYGTPGYKNSQWNDHPNNNPEIFINTPEYDPAFNEYTVAYQTDEPGYCCRIEIYTTEGRKVAELSNNRLLGTDGEIRWNGSGTDGNRLQAGMYVFFAELYHPNGKKNSSKKIFLIHANQ